MKKTAILFVAHDIFKSNIERYNKIKNDLTGLPCDVVWLCVGTCRSETITPPDGSSFLYYIWEDLCNMGYSTFGKSLIPGNVPLCVLRFYIDHPEYDYYWFIEYDVTFTGNWATLVEDCANNLAEYDFLSCHIEKFLPGTNGNWAWWKWTSKVGYSLHDCIKAFNPICRYSSQALQTLDMYLRNGHAAHSEVAIPTCLHHAGLRIGDIGGTGDFTIDGYRNRFYVQGIGINCGTMRWRPVYTQEEIDALGTHNKLFHPVK